MIIKNWFRYLWFLYAPCELMYSKHPTYDHFLNYLRYVSKHYPDKPIRKPKYGDSIVEEYFEYLNIEPYGFYVSVFNISSEAIKKNFDFYANLVNANRYKTYGEFYKHLIIKGIL